MMVTSGEAVLGDEGLRDREALDICPGHLFGALLILAGCLVVFLFGRTDHLICQRASSQVVTCELRETFFGAPLTARRIEDVQGVMLQGFNTAEDREPVYQVVLSSPGSEIPLAFPGSAAEDKERIATQIARFLGSAHDSDLVLHRVGVEGWFFGGMSILSGWVVLMYISDYVLSPATPACRDEAGH